MLSLSDIQPKLLQTVCDEGYVLDQTRFTTGRPDRTTLALRTRTGIPVVAKLYPAGGETAYANMQAAWRSSFGERRQPPGLPRPLDYLPGAGVLVMERLEGRPLAELVEPPEKIFEESIRLLAALHGSDAQPATRRNSRAIVRSVKRKAERIAEIAPRFVDVIRPVVEALETVRAHDTELVPAHGDFSARNVLVGPNRLALIDWDRFQWAHPARDVAYIGTHSWVSALRRGNRPEWSELKRAVAVYESVRPGAVLEPQLGFHVAAGLMRMACSLVELWPQEAHLVPELAAEALRHLDER